MLVRVPTISRTVPAVCLAYAALITLWLLLRLVLFDAWWPLAIVNTGAEYLFLPLPVLLAAASLARNGRALAGLLLPSAVFLLYFGELFVPRVGHDSGQPFTALTYNLLWSNTSHDLTATAILAAKPDVVGLQELSPEAAGPLLKRLSGDYPYHSIGQSEEVYGVGLLSRYPIEISERFSLPPMDLSLHAVLNVEGRRVHVIVVHLSPNNLLDFPASQFRSLAIERYARRAAETARLRHLFAGLNEPLLLLCDCNLTDTSQAHATLNSFMDDSFREAGWGFGHSLYHRDFFLPVQRLDYVWHNQYLTAISVHVGPRGGSDHRPVWARLYIRPYSP